MNQFTQLGKGFLIFLPFAILGTIDTVSKRWMDVGAHWPIFATISATLAIGGIVCLILGKSTHTGRCGRSHR